MKSVFQRDTHAFMFCGIEPVYCYFFHVPVPYYVNWLFTVTKSTCQAAFQAERLILVMVLEISVSDAWPCYVVCMARWSIMVGTCVVQQSSSTHDSWEGEIWGRERNRQRQRGRQSKRGKWEGANVKVALQGHSFRVSMASCKALLPNVPTTFQQNHVLEPSVYETLRDT